MGAEFQYHSENEHQHGNCLFNCNVEGDGLPKTSKRLFLEPLVICYKLF